jgi:16S rRNA (cytosine967-C5)-methyltransferase
VKVDAARLAAYDVLVAVREQDAYANLTLPALLRERRIEGRDAAFATELVGGTLRGLGAYDAVVDHLASRPPDPAVRDALRLGAHQLLGMRVPDHAAVTSTVELVRARVGHKPAGFANAVLRRMAARDLPGWMDELDAPVEVRTSHPRWIVDALAEALGRPEELEALLAADNGRPRVTLVARPGLSSVEEISTSLEQRAAASGQSRPAISRARVPTGRGAGVRRPGRRPRGARGACRRAGRRITARRAGLDPRRGRGA